jgi:hypothetical protein
LALHWPLCKFLHALPSYPRAIRTHLCCHCGFVVSFVTICLSHSFFAWVICFFCCTQLCVVSMAMGTPINAGAISNIQQLKVDHM